MKDELFEIIAKLKGISCVLSRETMCNSDSCFEWNEEEKMLLNSSLKNAFLCWKLFNKKKLGIHFVNPALLILFSFM